MSADVKSRGESPEELLNGEGMRIGIVVARFNSQITDAMFNACVGRLEELNVEVQTETTVETPGSFELPLAARLLIEQRGVDAVIALGAVIRGETAHFEHVAGAASQGLLRVADDTRKPVVFGVLTTDTVEQAKERIAHSAGYADAAVEMVNRFRALTESDRRVGLI